MDTAALRERLAARGVEIATAATETMLAALYEEAGLGLPSGIVMVDGPDLIDRTITATLSVNNAEAETIWQWIVGEPQCPFEPHQLLDGETFDRSNYQDVLASDGEFGSDFYYPLDHAGCQCQAIPLVGEEDFDPAGLAGVPIFVKAFGQTIAVTPAAPSRTPGLVPEWWSTVLTADRWAQAVQEAAAR